MLSYITRLKKLVYTEVGVRHALTALCVIQRSLDHALSFAINIALT